MGAYGLLRTRLWAVMLARRHIHTYIQQTGYWRSNSCSSKEHLGEENYLVRWCRRGGRMECLVEKQLFGCATTTTAATVASKSMMAGRKKLPHFGFSNFSFPSSSPCFQLALRVRHLHHLFLTFLRYLCKIPLFRCKSSRSRCSFLPTLQYFESSVTKIMEVAVRFFLENLASKEKCGNHVERS